MLVEVSLVVAASSAEIADAYLGVARRRARRAVEQALLKLEKIINALLIRGCLIVLPLGVVLIELKAIVRMCVE